MATKPLFVLLGGINGAGKSSAATELIGKSSPPLIFVNADQIARGLNGFFPESVAFEAGRILVEWLNALREKRANFSVETTLSGRSYIPLIQKLKAEGYEILLHYLWPGSVELAVSRVQYRVSQGGHDIPAETIHRRYKRSLKLFWDHYRPLADRWFVYNNSGLNTASIAEGIGSAMPNVLNEDVWGRFQKEIRYEPKS
ncbi:zeta toxin family protein [Telmatocola sphagniphila]|uniref:Zeta toxin family protein n=1 Tax=Telmatocola sphagniphila TaxID=1123043 RepID=A0A8E6EU30_9BACT|nr:zeta toxin family protein [Telmatocola sphagniphila]QVL30865.1 zeta toxin family protein [Telmatocola sphagniphila]